MATHDYVIANASGAAVRSDLNNALAAIVSNNSNATAPATTYAYMWWYDTTNGQLKQRNAANDDWNIVPTWDEDGRLLVGTTSASASCNSVFQGNSGASTGAGILHAQRGSANPSAATLGTIKFSDSNQAVGAEISGESESQWATNDYPGVLKFSTTADGASSPTERMRIGSNGVLVKYGNSTTARIVPQTDNAGYIGQATNRWQAIFAVNGTIQTSDEREKTEIVDSPLGTEFIKSLRPVAYKWKVGGYEHSVDGEGEEVFTPVPGVRTHYGFIAQEVRQAVGDTDFGGWLQEDLNDPESMQSLRLHEFISPIVKALQEAIAKIETLETRITTLEAAD